MHRRSTARILRVLPLALLLCLQPCARAAAPGGEVAGEGSGAGAGADLILELRPEKNRVYLHEAIPVAVTLLAGAVSVRDIQYPRLAGAAFRVTEFAPPRKDSVVRDGREYSAYEFSATLLPRRSGEIELGPAELRCDLLAPVRGAAAFFGGSEPRSVTLRSKPVHFSILPLPTRGRPAGYSGAVGHFTLSRQVTPSVIHSGDPVTVTTRIEGVGNIYSFSCQSILLSGVRSYLPRARRGGDRLACEQVLLPESATVLVIPEARISFFDPMAARYRTATSPALGLTLIHPERSHAASPVVVVPVAQSSRSWPLWGAFAGLLIVSASTGFLLTRRRRSVPGHSAVARPSLMEAEAALAANDPERFYEASFRLVQAAAAVRWNLSSPGLTAGLPQPDAEPAQRLIAELFQECDAVRYGRSPRNRQDMSRTIARLRELIATPS